MAPPLVDGAWLSEHISDAGLRVLDLRWYLDKPGRPAYLAGHIPGAVFVALEDITGARGDGRHPLPGGDQFQAAMRRAGVNRDARVIVYDDLGGYSAARLWWLFRYFDRDVASVLDGGLAAWRGELATGEEQAPAEGNFVAGERQGEMVLARDEVLAGLGSLRLVDARAGERYRGEIEPVDRRAGHIPGAANVPWSANLGPDKRFLPPPELRARYEAAGIRAGGPNAAYCGSGVSACVDLLALEVAGIHGVKLYAGSWSDWSAHPELPLETGSGQRG